MGLQMKDDLATNSVFILPDLNIDIETELKVWPLEVLYSFYFLNSNCKYQYFDCAHWRRMGIPDFVFTHASDKLFERVQVEFFKNKKAWFTEPISDEDERYRKLLPYNMLIEVL